MPPALKAALNPAALAVLGIGAIATVGLHSVPVAALTALTYVSLLAWEIWSTPAAPRLTVSGPVALPAVTSLHDPAVRSAIEGIARARSERATVLATAPASVTDHLTGALLTVEGLERNAVALVERAEGLSRWLATQDVDRAREALERAEERVAAARDPGAAADYARARDERAEHLRALSDVDAAVDRVRAHLDRIAATLSALPSKIVRMTALDAEAMDLVGAEVANDLAALDGEVRVFERTLESLRQGPPPGTLRQGAES